MVAYGFKLFFASRIAAGVKNQTIRRHRRRHARIGEPVQLYSGLRTPQCRKILPDPECIGLDEVRLDFRCFEGVFTAPTSSAAIEARCLDGIVRVNGVPVEGRDRQAYALMDGFGGLYCDTKTGKTLSPFAAMIYFWMCEHGPVLFEGVAIHWRPPASNSYACCECGRQFGGSIAHRPDELKLCAHCLTVPGWFRDPDLRRHIDPDHDGRETFETPERARP